MIFEKHSKVKKIVKKISDDSEIWLPNGIFPSPVQV